MTTWPNAPGPGGSAAGDPDEPQTRELPPAWTQPQTAPQPPTSPQPPTWPQAQSWPQPPTRPQAQSWMRPEDAAREQAQLAPPPPDQQWRAAAQPGTNWAAMPSPGWAPPAYAVAPPANGMAIASLVLGITSILFCWWGIFTLAQVVLAIVFGSIGMGRAARGARGRRMATAGLVCGAVGGLLYIGFGIITFGIGFLI